VDIIAANPQKEKVAFIQVKSRHAGQILDFEVSRKAFSWKGLQRFYVFVDNRKTTDPVYYIVPSETVSTVTKEAHWKWCQAHGQNPEKYTGRPGFYFAGHREVVKVRGYGPECGRPQRKMGTARSGLSQTPSCKR
jgi:hypothetical protein